VQVRQPVNVLTQVVPTPAEYRLSQSHGLHLRCAKRCCKCVTGGRMERTLRYGQRLMPFVRQIFFSEVRHMPRCLATAFSGILKYLDSSCIESSCVGGMVVWSLRRVSRAARPRSLASVGQQSLWRRTNEPRGRKLLISCRPTNPLSRLHALSTHLEWQATGGGGWGR